MRTRIVAFLIGNICLLYWPYFPGNHSILWLSGTVLFLTGLLYKARSYFVSLSPFFLSLSLISLSFLAGWGYSLFYIKNFVPVLDLKQTEGKTIRVVGQINSLVHTSEKRQQFEYLIKARQSEPESVDSPWDSKFSGKIRLNWYDTQQPLKIGQLWQFDVRLKKPNGLMNPGGFDYEKWLYHNRILATGYVLEGRLISDNSFLLQHPELKNEFQNFFSLSLLRQQIAEKLDTLLSDYPYKGLVKALSIGYRKDLTKEQWQLFFSTGTNHLIAISGLHIGLLSTLVWFFTNTLWKSFNWLNIKIPSVYAASILALFTAIIYAGLAGFAIPTLRALIMLSVVFVARLFKRELSTSYILLIALFFVLLVDPLSPLSPGFWLSFAAVGVILLSLSSRLTVVSGTREKVLLIGKVQASIFIGLLPLMIVQFQQFSIVSPVANLLAVPLMSILIVPLTLFSTMTSLIYEPAALYFFEVLLWLIDIFFGLLNWLNQSLNSFHFIPELPLIMVLLIFIGSLWALMPRGWPGRWLFIIFLIPAFINRPQQPQEGDAYLTALDVGQGLAVVVQTKNHSLLFDTGDKYSEEFNMAESVIIPFLRLKGIQKLDRVIVSHSDRDHSGSIVEILEQVSVSDLLSGEADLLNVKLSSKHNKTSDMYPAHAKSCFEGQQWQWDKVRFTVLSPSQVRANSKGNNNSCVLLIETTRGESILLTGDIEKGVEKQLLKRYSKLKVTVLQVPHHGSKTSSSESFIKQLDPQIALFSYGYRNRFRHPNKKVVQRFKKFPVKLYTTANGAIDIKRDLSNNSLSVTQYRLQNKRFWHRELEHL